MKLTSHLVLLLLGGCVFLSGCSTPPKVSDVIVTATGFRPAAAAQPRNHATMILNFTNENVIAIAFSSATHALYINGSYAGKAVSDIAIGLPPLATQTYEVTVVLENSAVVQQALAGPDQPMASYRLESVLQYSDGEDKYHLKAGGSGRVDVSGLEAAAR
jgi:LEA14-like dessication related protein